MFTLIDTEKVMETYSGLPVEELVGRLRFPSLTSVSMNVKRSIFPVDEHSLW